MRHQIKVEDILGYTSNRDFASSYGKESKSLSIETRVGYETVLVVYNHHIQVGVYSNNKKGVKLAVDHYNSI